MNLLNRSSFIETIGQISSTNDEGFTLIYAEINQALKAASLLQGITAEEQLINTIQDIICNKIKYLPSVCMGKLGWNRFAFIVKLPVNESLEVAEELAHLLDSQALEIDGVSYYPKLIFGVTPLSPHYKTAERILAAVDEALFQARRTGTSIVKLIEYDDPILHDYYNALNLLPKITEALKNRAFVLFAQPIVAINPQLSTEQKFEVLVRYKNEDGDIDFKSRFLEVAELFHMSREIDFYVVQQFCRFIASQPDKNVMYSLNIAGSTIRYSPFIDTMAKEFKLHGVNPEQVCFEITETVADRDYKQAVYFMKILKNKLGCQLSLDDIGIGSSNLANLAKFDVDFLKIDGSFIKNILTDPYSELVVNFITSAAKLYGRKTIAEYVENAEQLQKLKCLGVNFAQGFFTGEPKLLFDPSSMQ
jgi:EAL domain-containing protein (putative c-di-GMP-specific phosphodiesterase class I)